MYRVIWQPIGQSDELHTHLRVVDWLHELRDTQSTRHVRVRWEFCETGRPNWLFSSRLARTQAKPQFNSAGIKTYWIYERRTTVLNFIKTYWIQYNCIELATLITIAINVTRFYKKLCKVVWNCMSVCVGDLIYRFFGLIHRRISRGAMPVPSPVRR